MSIYFKLAAVAALSFSLASPGLTDPKPTNAKPVAAQSLANLYAGRTDNWKRNCGGGIYFGGEWQAQAYCNNNGEAVGLGEWSVTRDGRVCWHLTWYWQEGDSYGSKQEEKACTRNLVDAEGRVWRTWQSTPGEWWQMNVNDRKTFKLKRPIRKLRKKLKI